MLNRDQNQEATQGAIAIQSAGNVTVVTVQGISSAEARAIALDVAKATFYELSGDAKEIANHRVEEITDKVINKLGEHFPEGLGKAKDPDFQYALFNVQKEYARTGDEDLGDLLVDLLVDRSKQDNRNILQIVLNESIATAPKLTDNHLAALAVIFLIRYTQNNGIGNHLMLGSHLDRLLSPFSPKLSKNRAGFQHLEFSGCGSIGFAHNPIAAIYGTNYQGLFLKGFDLSVISEKGISIGNDSRFFTPCLNDPSKYQVKAIRKKALEALLEQHGVSAEDSQKIAELFDLNKMTDDEIKNKLIETRPYMEELIELWNTSPMGAFTLTSVGMAIGHANIKRLVGEFAPLEIWIN